MSESVPFRQNHLDWDRIYASRRSPNDGKGITAGRLQSLSDDESILLIMKSSVKSRMRYP